MWGSSFNIQCFSHILVITRISVIFPEPLEYVLIKEVSNDYHVGESVIVKAIFEKTRHLFLFTISLWHLSQSVGSVIFD